MILTLFIFILFWGSIIWGISSSHSKANALKKRVAKLEAQFNPKKEDPTEEVDQS